ncbi:hypothetical protein [Burkholderia oklahomensis]|uniref:hypothetical protein n=1 Tax=Burkholderia oklahomensis TaxID=342113 RepID=UPI001198201F|nr:hypothetical protein [Burkholderia oklahomensis]QPS37108.1 hypothetical protein I6G57_17890 [Burkholderia oklahomensis]
MRFAHAPPFAFEGERADAARRVGKRAPGARAVGARVADRVALPGSGIGSTSPSRDFMLELDCKQGNTGAFSVAGNRGGFEGDARLREIRISIEWQKNVRSEI